MVDLKLDLTTGDLVIGADGDFQVVTGDELMVQEVVFCLKTTKGDWTLSKQVGCDLEQFIGKTNDTDTLDQITSVVQNEISRLSSVGSFQVYSAPLDENTIVIALELSSREIPRKKIQVAATLDLKEGKVFARSDIF